MRNTTGASKIEDGGGGEFRKYRSKDKLARHRPCSRVGNIVGRRIPRCWSSVPKFDGTPHFFVRFRSGRGCSPTNFGSTRLSILVYTHTQHVHGAFPFLKRRTQNTSDTLFASSVFTTQTRTRVTVGRVMALERPCDDRRGH